jgi:hypothetical protein
MRPNTRAAPRPFLIGFSLLLLAADTSTSPEWKYEVVYLKNGRTLQGLVESESPVEIRMQCIRRAPGRPTVRIFTTIPAVDVVRVKHLVAADREVLVGRLKALDPTGDGERQRMEELALQAVPLPWNKDQMGFRYASDQFVLISSADEEIVRRAAVRIEEIYVAYTRYLPPVRAGGTPTTILLAQSMAEYQGLLRSRGQSLFNPAIYDPARNEIVCASELQKLGDELRQLKKIHDQVRIELNKREAEVARQLRGEPRERLRQEILANRQRLFRADQNNDKVFRTLTRRLFQTLYHEAFHAYLATYVHSPTDSEIPRWLNEGLAQVFESAVVEGGELRVGHADPERLQQAQTALRAGSLVPLGDLLRTRGQSFQLVHATDRATSDRIYLTSWAMAMFLTFDRRVLDTPELDRYLKALKSGVSPETAFSQLVNQTIPECEKAFHHYLRRLQPEGTLAPSSKK